MAKVGNVFIDPVGAGQLYSNPRYSRMLSTGCCLLDQCLGGGLDAHGITEISGVSGVGKTQLVLQCILQAQLPARHGGLAGGSASGIQRAILRVRAPL